MENNNQKSNKTGIIITISIVAIIIVLCILGYEMFKSDNNNETSEEKEPEKVISGSTKKTNSVGNELTAIESSTNSRNKKKMEDYEIVGTLEIPKTKLKCNILDEVTKRSIEIAVAKIYTAEGLNQPGNTVIYGHNYRNDLFFSKNDELEVGDKFYITDQEGNKKSYKITDKFITTSTDTSFYTKTGDETGGKAEATLSTCTDDASSTDRRLIIIGMEE